MQNLPWGTIIQVGFFALVIGFTVLQWIFRKLREQAEFQRIQEARRRAQTEALRTGQSYQQADDSEEEETPALAQPSAQAQRRAQLEELARRRQAQLEELRRRRAQQQAQQQAQEVARRQAAQQAPAPSPARAAPQARPQPAARTTTRTPGSPDAPAGATAAEMQRRRAEMLRRRQLEQQRLAQAHREAMERQKSERQRRRQAAQASPPERSRQRRGAVQQRQSKPQPAPVAVPRASESSRDALRRAVMLSEILAPPLSLRDSSRPPGGGMSLV